MANYHHGATYGSLAYDLDALAREKQLDEAGKLPQKKVRPAQPDKLHQKENACDQGKNQMIRQ